MCNYDQVVLEYPRTAFAHRRRSRYMHTAIRRSGGSAYVGVVEHLVAVSVLCRDSSGKTETNHNFVARIGKGKPLGMLSGFTAPMPKPSSLHGRPLS